MNAEQRLLLWLYARLLRLYPAEFRVEFGEEMGEIFAAALRQAWQRSPGVALGLAWRELRDLPGAVYCQHQRASGKRTSSQRANFTQALACLAPFLILGVFFNLANYLHLRLSEWAMMVAGFGSVGLMMALVVIGLARGLPAWWLPNLGIWGAFASLLFFNATINWFYNPRRPILDPFGPWLERALFQSAYLWLGLFASGWLIVGLSAFTPPLRPLYRRLRADWSLLSFGLYGAALPAIFFTFDDYVSEELIVAGSALALALGAWLYVRGAPRRRVPALAIGLTAAALITAVGKAFIFSLLPTEAQSQFTWQMEIFSTLVMWGWLALVVLSPVLLNFLPAPQPAQSV